MIRKSRRALRREPGKYEHIYVGGNKEEGVGDGKDDGNAQDGREPVS